MSAASHRARTQCRVVGRMNQTRSRVEPRAVSPKEGGKSWKPESSPGKAGRQRGGGKSLSSFTTRPGKDERVEGTSSGKEQGIGRGEDKQKSGKWMECLVSCSLAAQVQGPQEQGPCPFCSLPSPQRLAQGLPVRCWPVCCMAERMKA